jgi:hypothetical protein
LTTGQVAALTTDQLANLTTNQVAALETADLRALKTNQIAALTTNQISAGLSTNQVAALTTAEIAALTTDQVASGLTTNQIVALTTAQAAALTSNQVANLTTNQVAALETADLAALKTSQIAALTTNQVSAGLTTDQIVALTTGQVAALTTDQLANLTTNQVAALETADLRALKTNQIAALTTSQFNSLSTNQLVALTTTQVCALTTTQISALTTSQTNYLPLVTPIMLDLTGSGINTLSISSGVQFDLNAIGHKIGTGWVGQGSGLLVMDRNGDGLINDGSELFGSSTVLANGQKATNGYDALAALDTNSDNVISSADKGFADLEVWVDSNADGISQASELKTLDSLGITSLNLATTSTSEKNNGNWVGLASSYTTVDGANHVMADVLFVTDKNQAATMVGIVEGNQNLQTQVSALTQAMLSFDNSTLGSVDNANSLIPAPLSNPQLLPVSQGVTGNVSGMVDALKQFDSTGNLMISPVQSSSPLQASLTGQSLLPNDPSKTGFLAS